MLRLVGICIFFGLVSCHFNQSEDVLLAQVNEKQLYISEIKSILTDFDSEKDSLSFVKNWIESWAKKQLLVQQAQENLTSELLEVEQQMDDYYNSLLIYHYQKAMVEQKMDTNVYEHQIKQYYDEHKKEFVLNEPILQLIYVKISKDAPKISKLKKWYQSSKEEDRLFLEEYCYQFAQSFNLNDTSWVYLSEVLELIPSETTNNIDLTLKKNRNLILNDSLSTYFIHINKVKQKEDLSPLILVKDRVKNIILNKRKLAFLKSIKDDLYRNALAKGTIRYEAN